MWLFIFCPLVLGDACRKVMAGLGQPSKNTLFPLFCFCQPNIHFLMSLQLSLLLLALLWKCVWTQDFNECLNRAFITIEPMNLKFSVRLFLYIPLNLGNCHYTNIIQVLRTYSELHEVLILSTIFLINVAFSFLNWIHLPYLMF